MIRLTIFDTTLDNIDYKATRYINDNLLIMVTHLIDLLEDDNDFTVDDFLPKNNIRLSSEKWEEAIYDLEDIIQSDMPRDYIKPLYQYLLYVLLWWWGEITDDEENIIPLDMDSELSSEIMSKYANLDGEEGEGECFVLEELTNYKHYNALLFEDLDFLPSEIEKIVGIYLRSEEVYDKFFGDVDINEYYELIPRDLQEQFDKKIQMKADEHDVIIEEKLYADIIFCCERIQADNSLKDAIEDVINDKLRDLLDAKEYIERDQTRQGTSSTGKQAGEIDILVKSGKMPLSLIEALKLDCVNKSKLQEHIDKIYNYDTLGYEFNFLIAYVKTKDFEEFWQKYKEFVCSYEYPYKMIEYKIDEKKQYPELKCIEVLLNRNGMKTKLYNIVVHMPN